MAVLSVSEESDTEVKFGSLLFTILCTIDSAVCNQKNMAINTLHISVVYSSSRVSGAVS